ncbi:MAG: hypothetical protein JWO05_2363 [Gemmatimonadetes bacterium]|nr:hypothetical protein [Gemmatimonadota bacterium]
MIEVFVARLGLDAASKSYVVVLKELEGDRVLPIWIGQHEAESIVMEMHEIKRVRPLTHDLCKSIIVGLGGTLRGVHITRVEKSTYFAELHLQRGDHVVEIDARPSDCIAVALRLRAPIFADESLLLDVLDEEEGDLDPSLGAEDADEGMEADSGEGDDEDDDVPSYAPREEERELSAEQLRTYLERLRPEDFGKFNS